MQWFNDSVARRKRRKQRQERERMKESAGWKTPEESRKILPNGQKISEESRKASENSQKNSENGRKTLEESQKTLEENRNPGESRKKAGKRFLKGTALVLGVLLLAGGIITGMKYRDYWITVQAQLDILPDVHAKKGSLYGEEAQEIAPGSFWVLVNQIPTIEEGDPDCNLEYENPESNHYSARISLYLKETGKLLGNTKRVDPGNYVEMIRLKQELPVGEYPVRANIELFRNKTPAGNLSMDISLRVLEKGSPVEAKSVETEPVETVTTKTTIEITAEKEAAGWETAENGLAVSTGW